MKTKDREEVFKKFGVINCTKCGSTKPKEAFSKDKTRTFGYRTDCKQCNKDYREAVKLFEKDELVQVNLSWFDKFKMWLSA